MTDKEFMAYMKQRDDEQEARMEEDRRRTTRLMFIMWILFYGPILVFGLVRLISGQ